MHAIHHAKHAIIVHAQRFRRRSEAEDDEQAAHAGTCRDDDSSMSEVDDVMSDDEGDQTFRPLHADGAQRGRRPGWQHKSKQQVRD